jgi:hypothetical protein
MSNIAESFEHVGLTVRICLEEDSSFCDPRDNCNLGTMVCAHGRYTLGDEQVESYRSDFRSWRQIARWFSLTQGAIGLTQLGLIDHSGISMYVGGGAHWSDSAGWDSGTVGIIFTTKERIAELCGEPVRNGDPYYCPRDWEGTAEEWICKQLAGEVEEYDSWLRGEVYYYVVEDENGNALDQCGGYVGDSEWVIESAKEAAEHCAAGIAERKAATARGWALAHHCNPHEKEKP